MPKILKNVRNEKKSGKYSLELQNSFPKNAIKISKMPKMEKNVKKCQMPKNAKKYPNIQNCQKIF